jgi:hypothetical protein
MKISITRWALFTVSLITVFSLDFFCEKQNLLFNIIKGIAMFFVIYEITLQILKMYFNDIYYYLLNYLSGNIRLNQPLHGNSPLTLWEKNKTVILITALHLLAILLSIILTIKA